MDVGDGASGASADAPGRRSLNAVGLILKREKQEKIVELKGDTQHCV